MMFKYCLSFQGYGYIKETYDKMEGWKWIAMGKSGNPDHHPVLVFSRKKGIDLKNIVAYDDFNDQWYSIPTSWHKERDEYGVPIIRYYKDGPVLARRFLDITYSKGFLFKPYKRGPRIIKRQLVTADAEVAKQAVADYHKYQEYLKQRNENLKNAKMKKPILLPHAKSFKFIKTKIANPCAEIPLTTKLFK